MAYTYQPYPRSLYRKSERGHVYHGVPCDVLTVGSEEAEEAAKANGWHNSPVEADATTAAQSFARFDHDGDGRPGGSLPKAARRRKVKRRVDDD